MKRMQAKAPSQRQLRVAEEIRHALSWILERDKVHDPGIAGHPLTVTEVRIGADLKSATVFVAPLGGGDAKELVSALTRAAPFLRHELAGLVRLKFLPRLSFVADLSFDEASRIDHLLKDPRVVRDLDGDERES